MAEEVGSKYRLAEDAKAPELDGQDTRAVLDVALQAALKAGSLIRSHSGRTAVEKNKVNKNDLVTAVDKKCEEEITAIVKSAFPSHQILGEESVPPGPEAAAKALKEFVAEEWLWIVDPIDGTTNFVGPIPCFSPLLPFATHISLSVVAGTRSSSQHRQHWSGS